MISPTIDAAVRAALAKATANVGRTTTQLRNLEERLEAEAQHILRISDPEAHQCVIENAIDFGAQMSAYKRYELVRVGGFIYGFAGDTEQVLAKVLAIINE